MKSILLHIHDDSGQTARIEAALDLARLHGAHLTCLQSMPFAAFAGEPFSGAVLPYEIYAEQMKATREKVEADLRNEDVPWDWIDARGNGSYAMLVHSQLADLVVLSPPGRAIDPDAAIPVVGEIVVRARTPALVVRDEQRGADGTLPVLIAWNGSPESAAAVRSSLAFIAKAGAVHILAINRDSNDHLPARDAASYLSRHGISVEVHAAERGPASIAETIQSVAADVGAGTIIMGAYGHSRLYEFMLGGVTREMLRDARLPVIFAH